MRRDQKNNPSAPLGLFYASRWSSTEKAAKFAERSTPVLFRSAINKRKKLRQTRLIRLPRKGAQPNADLLQGRHEWKTEEGAVVIEEKGDTVLISESLDPATTQTLEREVLGN